MKAVAFINQVHPNSKVCIRTIFPVILRRFLKGLSVSILSSVPSGSFHQLPVLLALAPPIKNKYNRNTDKDCKCN